MYHCNIGHQRLPRACPGPRQFTHVWCNESVWVSVYCRVMRRTVPTTDSLYFIIF